MQVLGPPTETDARRAARELAAAGASRVLMFGSLARGEAGEHSDIDLVAVFDDIDYSQRRRLASDLSDLAEAAAGHPVEVFVTDRAEWKCRTTEVSASFEAGIAPATVTLIDRPAGAVRWDKEIGFPSNNTDEALGRLDEASKALNSMRVRLQPEDWEILEPRNRRLSLWRMIDICSAGTMTVETSLKALIAADGTPTPFKHEIHRLVPLAGAHSEAVRTVLADLTANTVFSGEAPYGDLTIWRKAGTYIADRPDIDLPSVARLAPRIARAATATASIAAHEIAPRCPDSEIVTHALETIRKTTDILTRYDIITDTESEHPPQEP